jgi:hypothetical protein
MVSGGITVGRSCVAPTRRNSKRARCTRTIVAGRLPFSAHAGQNKVLFYGLISRHRKLGLGRYTLLITATASGKAAVAGALHFTITRG